jgi:acetylornithine deacetylase
MSTVDEEISAINALVVQHEQWRAGCINGRGAIDAKGQIMTAVLALLALKDLGYTPPGNVILQSVVGEEPSGNGTLALCEQGVRADAAVVLEPTDGHVAYGHRGILGLRFRLQGGASHEAFGSHKNAIVTAGVLAGILNDALSGWSSLGDAVYGPPTVNVGRIAGGESIFSSPHDCMLECGIRYAPGTDEQVLAHILESAVHRFTDQTEDPWTSIKTQVFNHFDAGETPVDHPLVQGLVSTVREIIPDREQTVFPGGCDARHFINRSRIPTVIFGSGSLRQAHGIDEYLSIGEWMSAATALVAFITRWCR